MVQNWNIGKLLSNKIFSKNLQFFASYIRFKEESNFEWKTNLLEAPECKNDTKYLNLVKTARSNSKRRNLFRMFHKIYKELIIPRKPDLNNTEIPAGKKAIIKQTKNLFINLKHKGIILDQIITCFKFWKNMRCFHDKLWMWCGI